MKNIRQEIIAHTKKILVKIGSAVLTGDDGLDLKVIDSIVQDMSDLKNQGYALVLVTSGAIVSGKHRMKIAEKLKSIPEKQAAAAIGQGRLMRVYSKSFEGNGHYVAQILLTLADLTDRRRYLNIRNTLSTLLEWGAIPIINENDTVAVDEIKFGDNDNLAAMIANIIEADLFINLTSTAGLYDGNPSVNKKAKLIPVVSEFSKEIEAAATSDTSSAGTGGMKSKIQAAKKVTAIGIPCIIAPGKKEKVLTDIMAGKEIGTLFLPMADRLNSKKYWIAFTLRPRGKLVIDDGAKKALLEKGKSLLPSGVIEVEGNFDQGDPVICVDQDGTILAKGLVNYNTEEIHKIKGLKTKQIYQVLGHKDYDEIIHRDNMAVTGQHYKR
ncbi:MAG TPA: glutamate 5-kinase [Smithella sp.]|nr:glutamate 5-kinase [Smithella sp.]MDM7988804.1 glutamate 5-kinase [Smithella sp.]HOG91222.1 glutamate 5-kinase [Smithella sp.]HOU51031.1 glutamate 5-kinase [Smithella sp.]HQG66158.1 glutamate 5-kinase [Smithella sp.]